MVEIGIHPPQTSPHPPTFESRVVKILAGVPTFHTKIEHVETEIAISYQLDPSNLTL